MLHPVSPLIILDFAVILHKVVSNDKSGGDVCKKTFPLEKYIVFGDFESNESTFEALAVASPGFRCRANSRPQVSRRRCKNIIFRKHEKWRKCRKFTVGMASGDAKANCAQLVCSIPFPPCECSISCHFLLKIVLRYAFRNDVVEDISAWNPA